MNLAYDYDDYSVKPTYIDNFSGETKLVALDGQDWGYNESKTYFNIQKLM